mgnify:FL=1|tara:strand:- start:2002 stop:3072 length:1071 start_codon:yes stop_codon:yes gene_type:complete
MFKPSEAKKSCLHILKGSNIPFLIGGTGVGKSAIVKEIAEELANGRTLTDDTKPKEDEFGFISFRLGLVESIDLGGLPYIDEDTGEQKKAFLGNLPKSGEGLFFLDEFAQAHSSVQATIGQLLDPKGKNDERKIGDYVFPSGWKIVLAGNRHTDRSGANKVLRHCQDRTTAIQFTHDVNDWLDWADSNDVDLNVQGLIRFMPQLLWNFDPKCNDPQPSPRSWVRLSDTLKTNPPKELRQKLFEGDVGQECAIELMNFISLQNDVPNISKICKGDEVELIDEAGLCYATTIALTTAIAQADDKNIYDYFENALNYVKQFSTVEFSIFFVRKITGLRSELKECDVYSKFKVDNQDLEI